MTFFRSHTIKVFSLTIILAMAATSCQEIEIDKTPQIKTVNITDITGTSAIANGEITDIGEGILEYGHCWGAFKNPTVAGLKSSFRSVDTIGLFTTALYSLEADSTYYVRSYCIDKSGVIYGNSIHFTTQSPSLPEITTGKIVSNDTTSLTIKGKIHALGIGQKPVDNYGHCWSTKPNPTTEDFKTNFGASSDTITYVSKVDSILSNTTYYIRAYAINEVGIAYGNEISITGIQSKPTIETRVSSYGTSWAGTRTRVTNTGGLPTEAFLCWNLSGNPTINDSLIKINESKSPFDDFYYPIHGLSGDTKYYLRAYVKNSIGTNYSNEITFRTAQATLPTCYIQNLICDISNTLKFSTYITSRGSTIKYAGICWSENPTPDITSNIIEVETKNTPEDLFESLELPISTSGVYYLRAFAQNKIGISYSEIFKLNIPEADIQLSLGLAKSYLMGSNTVQSDALPVHTVNTKTFLISSYEVTNQQYCDFLNQSNVTPEGYLNEVHLIDISKNTQILYSQNNFHTDYPNHPAVYISWQGANAYCKWVGGRLPTEAEWESLSNDNFGNGSIYSGSDIADGVAWHQGNSSGGSNLVGQKYALMPEIYDMSGNVREWCSDWYDPDYYSVSPLDNPQGPESGTLKVVRGGSFLTGIEKCKISTRDYASPDTCAIDIGFRVVMD